MNHTFHNVPESTLDDAQSRKQYDIDQATNVFKAIGVTASITNAMRLGKKSTKPHLLKITVNSIDEKVTILCNCTKLRATSSPEQFHKVFTCPDLTPKERERDKVLCLKLADMNQSGHVYKIKNGRIMWRENQVPPFAQNHLHTQIFVHFHTYLQMLKVL